MANTLTYFGHAAFMLTHDDQSIVFDPFFTGNTWDKAKAEDIKAQYIFVSHGHDDHYGDTEAIAKANDALVISTAEICLVPAFHGAGVPGGHAAGCLVDFYGTRLYFAGDTCLYSDMKLHNRFGDLDYALLPIGDTYTMGIDDAALAASWVDATITIPIHYKTWPVIDKEPGRFTALLEAKYKKSGLIVEPGTSIEL